MLHTCLDATHMLICFNHAKMLYEHAKMLHTYLDATYMLRCYRNMLRCYKHA